MATLYSCNSLFVDKTKPAKIKIRKGFPDSDKLRLHDWIGLPATDFTVDPGRQIRWFQEANEVASVDSIYPQPGGPDIFSVLPHRIIGTQDWGATIDLSDSEREVKYNIVWADTNGHPHKYDPKIAVKPETFFTPFVILLASIFAGVSVIIFRRRKNIKKTFKE
ncbi:MAG: hypothetical protein M3Z92_04785 [Bacteroidota bacterium]|nr:hypothetical protein [Bacteroidota bacterium]